MNITLATILLSGALLFCNAPIARCDDFIAAVFFQKHKHCVPERWVAAGSNLQYDFLYYYDSQTVEIKNKYNPFGDKIVILWGLNHWTGHQNTLVGTHIHNYEINIDKRTYKMLDIKKPTVHNIRPESIEEALWKVAKTLY